MQETPTAELTPENDTVELTPKEAAVFAPYDAAVNEIMLQARGALAAIVRLRNLDGQWARKGNQLVRAE